jgi:hypothetical protein
MFVRFVVPQRRPAPAWETRRYFFTTNHPKLSNERLYLTWRIEAGFLPNASSHRDDFFAECPRLRFLKLHIFGRTHQALAQGQRSP